MTASLLGICFLREATERAIGSDRRAGKGVDGFLDMVFFMMLFSYGF